MTSGPFCSVHKHYCATFPSERGICLWRWVCAADLSKVCRRHRAVCVLSLRLFSGLLKACGPCCLFLSSLLRLYAYSSHWLNPFGLILYSFPSALSLSLIHASSLMPLTLSVLSSLTPFWSEQRRNGGKQSGYFESCHLMPCVWEPHCVPVNKWIWFKLVCVFISQCSHPLNPWTTFIL